jgi:hypothetical protein
VQLVRTPSRAKADAENEQLKHLLLEVLQELEALRARLG